MLFSASQEVHRCSRSWSSSLSPTLAIPLHGTRLATWSEPGITKYVTSLLRFLSISRNFFVDSIFPKRLALFLFHIISSRICPFSLSLASHYYDYSLLWYYHRISHTLKSKTFCPIIFYFRHSSPGCDEKLFRTSDRATLGDRRGEGGGAKKMFGLFSRFSWDFISLRKGPVF